MREDFMDKYQKAPSWGMVEAITESLGSLSLVIPEEAAERRDTMQEGIFYALKAIYEELWEARVSQLS